MDVHKEMGCGFLEAVYQEALDIEFKRLDVPVEAQPVIEIFYKGILLEKKYQPDFINNVENHALWAWSEFKGFASKTTHCYNLS